MARRRRRNPSPVAEQAAGSSLEVEEGRPEGEDVQPVHEAGGMAQWRLSLAVYVGLLVLDQATKVLAHATIGSDYPYSTETIPIIPGLFQLRYEQNQGAAFSMLHGHVGFLTIVSIVASIALMWYWTKLPAEETWGRLALAMMVAGAVGNLIDRAFRGYVVDFFDAYIGSYHWPVFNVADSVICIGVGILIMRAWQRKI